MKIFILLPISLLLVLSFRTFQVGKGHVNNISPDTIISKQCFSDDRMTKDWTNALTTRMTRTKLDSVAGLIRPVTTEEKKWIALIETKTTRWNTFKDSIEIPFRNCKLPDTIYIYIGYSGADDAFTYGFNTVCLDITAFQTNYGSATLPENSDRIDRIFSHELTHLVSKEWARKNNLALKTFKDSVLWECLYEGLGMYRSLPAKWLPRNGVVPEITKNALLELSPVFVNRLVEIEQSASLSEDEKNRIVANLSRGPVSKKWGAFTVAIWLALEANGDDRNLQSWTEKGLNSVLILARKYLTGDNKAKFEAVF